MANRLSRGARAVATQTRTSPGGPDAGRGEDNGGMGGGGGSAAWAPSPLPPTTTRPTGPPRRLCKLSHEQVSDTHFPEVDSEPLPV